MKLSELTDLSSPTHELKASSSWAWNPSGIKSKKGMINKAIHTGVLVANPLSVKRGVIVEALHNTGIHAPHKSTISDETLSLSIHSLAQKNEEIKEHRKNSFSPFITLEPNENSPLIA